MRRHGIAPAPKRCQTYQWRDFIAAHMSVLSGIDFFTLEVLTWRGLATYYMLFLIQLETRRVTVTRLTRPSTPTGTANHPDMAIHQVRSRDVTSSSPYDGTRLDQIPFKPLIAAVDLSIS